VHLAQLDGAQVLYVDKRNAAAGRDVFPGRQGRAGLLHRRRQGDAGLSAGGGDAPELRAQAEHPFTPKTITTAEAMRAELAAIRARGIAFDDEEHEPGIICVAVPILTRAGRVLGAVS
jgi:IclR family KDG regulon transcriptional repressor